MKDLSLLVSNIKQKAEKLVAKQQLLEKENKTLVDEIEKVKKLQTSLLDSLDNGASFSDLAV